MPALCALGESDTEAALRSLRIGLTWTTRQIHSNSRRRNEPLALDDWIDGGYPFLGLHLSLLSWTNLLTVC